MGKLDKKLYEQLLIPVTKRTKPQAQAPIPTTPLLTNFENWSDKRRKLFFRDYKEYQDLKLPNFKLETNTLAQKLASPMRSERNSRSRVPKDLLIQLKPVKENNKRTTLKPIIHHYHNAVSTYICNNKTALQHKSCDPSLWKTTQHLQTPDDLEVTRDKSQFLHDYGAELRAELHREFAAKDTAMLVERKPSKNDVQLYINPRSTKLLTIIQVSKKTKILGINIGTQELFPSDIVQTIKNKGPLTLRNPDDSTLIYLIYKSLNYFK